MKTQLKGKLKGTQSLNLKRYVGKSRTNVEIKK